MLIIDTYQAILDIFSNNTFSLDIWDKYADSISSTFKEKVKDDASNYDFNLEILPIISQLLQNRDKFEQAHKAFINVTKELPKRVIDVLNTDLDVSIIFYLGLCNGAGWATSLDGKMVVLLGIEKIVELNWYDERNMIALIYHELGHIWHKHVRTTPTTIATQKENALWQLYSEGMAMHCEQLLYGDTDFYHQDKGGWLNWCRNNRNRLFKEYKKRIDTNISVQSFYGDWSQFEGHSDIGYYLGTEFIKQLSEEYSLYKLANLDMQTIAEKFSCIEGITNI